MSRPRRKQNRSQAKQQPIRRGRLDHDQTAMCSRCGNRFFPTVRLNGLTHERFTAVVCRPCWVPKKDRGR